MQLTRGQFPKKLSHSGDVSTQCLPLPMDFLQQLSPSDCHSLPEAAGSNRASLNTSQRDDTQDKTPSCHLLVIYFITQAVCLPNWVFFPPTPSNSAAGCRALNHTFLKGDFCFCNSSKLLGRMMVTCAKTSHAVWKLPSQKAWTFPF